MLYSSILAFAATALAAPLIENRQVVPLCTSGTPQCCATDVLNLADLDCAPPTTTPTTINGFIDTCTVIGQQAKCCLLPILGQALICSDVNPQPEVAAPAAAA
ncbi:fungal hydrophobin-domain-containing protein [Massariosphaeria phaeospora]|uniref:Fungal hydrophobin-domain-containing protein n=1 Tax=Massariosphaeria phaeospora TaxID=100035 RepID=A0A7C8MNZ0_9PLEO|nr:fungal hydrophobin-domain-containing protein [Massariosphaeria phaeospora]